MHMALRLALSAVFSAVAVAGVSVEVPLKYRPLRVPRGQPGPKLVAVLHPGTFKTGSSTIQDAIISRTEVNKTAIARLLAGEGLRASAGPAVVLPRIPGTWTGPLNHANLAVYLQYKVPESSWTTLTDFLASASRNWSHVLISSEFLAQPGVPNAPLINALQPTWSVRVVLVYRRFFSWLVSVHYQKYKFRKRIGTRAGDYRSLVEFLSIEHMRNESRGVWSGAAFDRYTQFPGVTVQLLNMHDTSHRSGSLIAAFVCDYLPGPGAEQACRWLTQTTNGKKVATLKANTGGAGNHIHLVELAFAATRRGALPPYAYNLTSSHVVAHLKRHLVNATLPTVCITQAQREFLWELSKSEEARLLPHWHDPLDMRAAFNADVGRKKFCSVDATAALANETILRVVETVPRPRRRRRVNGTLTTANGTAYLAARGPVERARERRSRASILAAHGANLSEATGSRGLAEIERALTLLGVGADSPVEDVNATAENSAGGRGSLGTTAWHWLSDVLRSIEGWSARLLQ